MPGRHAARTERRRITGDRPPVPAGAAPRAREAAGTWLAAARGWVLRHCNARDVTLALMVLAFPLAKAAEDIGVLPRHRAYAAGAGTATVCGVVLWWLTARGQRRWRERGGTARRGGNQDSARLDALEGKMGELFSAMDEACRAVGIPVAAREDGKTPLRLVVDNRRDSA